MRRKSLSPRQSRKIHRGSAGVNARNFATAARGGYRL